MNEELQRHDILINEVDEKMDKVTKELQTNNMRLKGLVTKVRARGWACRAGGRRPSWLGWLRGRPAAASSSATGQASQLQGSGWAAAELQWLSETWRQR